MDISSEKIKIKHNGKEYRVNSITVREEFYSTLESKYRICANSSDETLTIFKVIEVIRNNDYTIDNDSFDFIDITFGILEYDGFSTVKVLGMARLYFKEDGFCIIQLIRSI